MGSRQSVLETKKIIVIGGGFAGAHAAKHLKGKCQLTIIDPREYLHYSIGSLRATVEPGFESKILVPHEKAWGDSFKQGKVTSVDPRRKVIILESGEELPYDIVVIATGSSSPFPGKLSLDILTTTEATQHYKDLQNKVKSAQKITIVGGGAVGIELAGEIVTDYHEKEVTVVNAAEDIINGPYKAAFRKKVREMLQNMGVKLILGEHVSNLNELPKDGSEPCQVKTDNGKEIEADLVINSNGLQANSGAYEGNFADKMDDHGFLKVNEFLQVDGYEDVFAIGDCNNADQVKMALKAQHQMELLVRNLKALVTGGKMKPYKEVTIMSLSLGRNGGVTQFNSLIFGAFLTKQLKSQDMFIGRFWKETMQLEFTDGESFNV